MHLTIDANQSYSPKAAIYAINRMAEFGLDLVEQPVPRNDLKGLALVTRFDPRPQEQGPCSLEAAVPEDNLPMQLLLRSVGYKAVRVLRGFHGDEAAYLMQLERE